MNLLKFAGTILWIIAKALISTALVLGILFFYAHKIEPNWVHITNQDVRIERLPKEFQGLRIVHISDFHGFGFKQGKLISRINDLQPDMVVITGDVFEDDAEVPLNYADKVFSGLRTRYGAFFVLGNNDYYLGSKRVSKKLSNLGIKTLINENCKLTKDGQNLWIIGVSETEDEDPNLVKAFKGVNFGPKLLLAHSPEIAYQGEKMGIDLILAGHTHGGQIMLPGIPRLITHVKKGFEKYVSGLYEIGHTQMYITRGLGMTKIPVRFLAPPEISVITLEVKE